ncbi:hypothetical protein BU23DRAFT_593031 [Bimuria novae-zelandiae CBS 107.79]|uniref:DNA repair protein Dds20/Mei5 n=1 Tax=Bimuria novae-zelandiae CBS 107.79 TaxID=1447943 RepID=A0A6A5US57_9PLEO|nr:hypothetical protein BU23DRAFT_593031 [Bimuria novae-zelandiae CBS 107.79]
MSTPQAKRRRLNEASKTLHKPFKSPFRTPLKPNKPNLGSDPPSSDPPETSTTSASALSNDGTVQQPQDATASRGSSHQHTPNRPVPAVAKPLVPRAGLPTPSRPRPSQKKTTPSKPSLTREIIQLRNDIQILSQAHTLAASTKDDDLLVLIEQWRTASRAAAEELFATTRDRVNRMGGVGAWKDREREQKEWKMKAEREEMEAERERLEEAMEEAKERGELGEEAYERYPDAEIYVEKEEEKETFKAADDDSFTMDMMLKTLNIDLQLIGYNKEAQRWDD